MKNIKHFITLSVLAFFISSFAFAEKGPGSKDKSTKVINAAGCVPASAMTYLDLNNVRALILNGGDMWWDLSKAKYEVPKGSGKMALFAGAIWVGGVDVNGQLRLAAQMHRNDGNDYWPGPLISTGDGIASVSADVCLRYDRHFKISRNEVSTFRAWFNSDAETKNIEYPGYSIPDVIINWPAHGPSEGAYDYYLAPFKDVDGDGYYNPYNGDYPYYDLDAEEECNTAPERRAENLGNQSSVLFGDQTLWWVYNDKGNIHTQTTGAASIGMEFRAQAFAFSTNDELNNMTFYNYQIINRSTYTLTDTYFGVWSDADLGNAKDDYVGCDVNKGLGYLYNGDDEDEQGTEGPINYGKQPPAIGIDFFEGPYQDPDGNDNLSSWDEIENLDCSNGYRVNPLTGKKELAGPGDIDNGNINGLNFGDNVVDNERWGMRRFLYFNNGGGSMGDPHTALEYYNYLKGIWLDKTKLQYGGTGHKTGGAPADFMFPNDTDPCGWGTSGIPQEDWSEKTEGNTPDDRRFVQSAGPFVLEPGAVNDITIGAVWARAQSGGAWASVEEVRYADDKAQKLFENCFQLLDGPDAPELDVVELDKELIFHIWNSPASNNYLERYHGKDPFIPSDVPLEDRYYDFQGYQVYQLANSYISIADIHNVDLARLVFQCDIKDGVTRIINYEWDKEISANIPIEEVNGADEGIVHTFTITDDAFASGDKALVNHKKYYYVAIAYAYNDYKHYDQTTSSSLGVQTTPYKAGRKAAKGSIKVVEAIPHFIEQTNDGTVLNSKYGDCPEIELIEGMGNGNNYLDLTDETIDNILSKTSKPFKADVVKYKKNAGPIQVKVIDPLNVPDADFKICFEPDSVNMSQGSNYYNLSDKTNSRITGLILDTKWKIIKEDNGVSDTVYSDSWIRYEDEKVLPEWGISVMISQIDYPDVKFGKLNDKEPLNNGFLSASFTYEKETPAWLSFVSDEEGASPQNWIRVGTLKDEENSDNNDYIGRDNEQIYEKILGGTWAPYALCSKAKYGPVYAKSLPASIQFSKYRLSSVDLVITKDQTKWTRCPVVEMCENDDGTSTSTLSEGHALRFDLRASQSLDKNGVAAAVGSGDDTTNINNPNFIGETGMSWFPGYAIDIETGERLNIMFGEDSWLVGENGRDMLWNPTSNYYEDLYYATAGQSGQPLFGGKHYIYIMGHNVNGSNVMPSYDYGEHIYHELKYGNAAKKSQIYMNAMWTAIPLSNKEFTFKSYDELPDNDVTIKLRIANPYLVGVKEFALAEPENENYPVFKFSTSELSAQKSDLTTIKNSLDKINVVPNPYYGYSEYEKSQLDNIVKITNLPKTCTISIYTVNGTLVRRIKKDSEQTYIDWDLKNNYSISIASGVYIIHVDVEGVGEKVLKWFGALRPIDLNSF
ncbi:MAG: T9SS C-terminal target domain-containing protein [Bacteroidetes bacterium]|nr:MAG: T9SS C-terminal target domain-containing protein [Bacteroidota bacterium]